MPVQRITDIITPTGLANAVRARIDTNAGGLRDTITAITGNTFTVVQNSDGTWPTITRRAWLMYAWRATADPNALPTPTNGAAPGDQLIGFSEAFLT